MTLAGRRVPHSTWIAVAVAIAVIGWAFLWFNGNLVMTVHDPDPASREYVAAQLASAQGVPLPLPVRLPAGYEPPYDYSTSVGEDGIAHARSTRFLPSAGAAPKGASVVVVLCGQGVDDPVRACAPPPTVGHVERVVGRTLLVMWAEYPPKASLDQWKSLEVTTDLNKVTWLH